ncbi:SLAC1 anion channel family protein [Shimia sp. SDUM112013]|uniref:SLAC1 anion channel family protein n=1 Tax=Shimia sp. SDUM112013 TaxID=3136160 RepID=UPI0032ED637B
MSDATPSQIAAPEPRLKHFPVPFFAVVMGLMGLTLALHAGAAVYPVLAALSTVFLWLGVLAFIVISVFYIAKVMRYRAAVQAEWNHPVRLAFFPAISISILLIATALFPSFPEAARGLWIIGAVLQAILTLAVISGWISHRAFEVGQLTPAWFIPAVGNVVAPVAGAPMGFVELSWLFFSTGLVFWVVLLTLVFNRLIFHNPIPGKLYPTLVILIAPPAVAFLAYINLTGGVDSFARILLNSGYVFAALMVVQIPNFAKLPFALPWWALSFPVAALTIASFRFAALTGSQTHVVIGTGILLVLCAIMVGLIYRTLVAILRNEICVPE